MTGLLDDTTLLAALGEVLAPEPAAPDAAALAALHRALDHRAAVAADPAADRPESAPVVAIATATGWGRRGGTLHRLRHPVAAAAAVAVLATGGVAAAGVATDHLPGPARSVAYDLGLPVSSPSLVTARGTLGQLQAALGAHDPVAVRAAASQLRAEVATLSPADRAALGDRLAVALAQATVVIADRGTTSGTGSTVVTGGTVPGTGPTGTSTGGSHSGGDRSGAAGTGDDVGGGDDGSGTARPGGAGGSTVTTTPPSDDGSGGTGTASGPGAGGGGTPTTTPTTVPGGTPTTTVPTTGGGSGGGSDDGGAGGGGSGVTDNAVAPTGYPTGP